MGIIESIKADLVGEADLLEYVTSNDITVAIAAAESKSATEPILAVAAHDRDKRVRLAALNNKNVETETLEFLIHDMDREISDRAEELFKEKQNELVL